MKFKEYLKEARLPIFDIGTDIIMYFDNIKELKKYKVKNAEYDDVHYTVPRKAFDKIIGWSDKDMQKISDDLENHYEGDIQWDKKEVTLFGAA